MSMPIEVKELCNNYLILVQHHPQHHLNPNERFNLYKSFGKSRIDLPEYKKTGQRLDVDEYTQFYKDRLEHLTLADHVLGWLSILTVRHILPIWNEKFEMQIQLQNTKHIHRVTPHQIIEAAENVINRTAKLDKVFFDSNNDYHMGSKIKEYLTYDLACIYTAASSVLGFVLYGEAGVDSSGLFVDDDISYIFGDYASEAVKAYSVIDTNKPGAWVDEGFRRAEVAFLESETDEDANSEFNKVFGMDSSHGEDILTRLSLTSPEFEEWQNEQMEQKKTFKQLIFDPIKRLEFWEWWLTEAVPQAWEIAEQTYLL